MSHNGQLKLQLHDVFCQCLSKTEPKGYHKYESDCSDQLFAKFIKENEWIENLYLITTGVVGSAMTIQDEQTVT